MELLFFVMSIFIVVMFPCRYILKMKKCKEEVEATVVSYKYSGIRVNGYAMYTPTCTYYYKGREYTNEVKWYEEEEYFSEGMIEKIRICKDDPNFAYRKGSRDGTIITMPVVLSILFFIIGLASFFNNNRIVDFKSITNKTLAIVNDEKDVGSLQSRNVSERQINNKDGQQVDGEKQYGSDMTSDKTDANVEYLQKSTLREDIKGVKFYLPNDYEKIEEAMDLYVYKHIKSNAKIKIYYNKNDTSIQAGFEGFESQLKNEIILSDIREYEFNNNVFKHVKIRNKYDEYLDVVYSVNNKYTIYIEYQGVWGYENIVVDFISSLKY